MLGIRKLWICPALAYTKAPLEHPQVEKRLGTFACDRSTLSRAPFPSRNGACKTPNHLPNPSLPFMLPPSDMNVK